MADANSIRLSEKPKSWWSPSMRSRCRRLDGPIGVSARAATPLDSISEMFSRTRWPAPRASLSPSKAMLFQNRRRSSDLTFGWVLARERHAQHLRRGTPAGLGKIPTNLLSKRRDDDPTWHDREFLRSAHESAYVQLGPSRACATHEVSAAGGETMKFRRR